MILVVEPECKGYSHIDFNTSIIRTLVNSGEQIIFIGDSTHIAILKQKCHSNVSFFSLKTTNIHKNLFYRLIIDFIFIFKIFSIAKINKTSKVIFLSCNAPNLYVIKLFSWINSNLYIDVYVHGILEEIATGKPYLGYRNPFNWYKILFWFGWPFLLPAPHTFRFILLSPSMCKEVRKIYRNFKIRLDAITHPIPDLYYEQKKNILINSRPILRLAWFGILNHAKGGSDFKRLIEAVTLANAPVSFDLLGFCNDPSLDLSTNLKLHGDPTHFLSDMKIQQVVPLIDYAIFTYPANSYKLTASGALCTALGYSIPVLCLENNYFRDFFIMYGDIGKMYKNIEDLKEDLIKNTNELIKARNKYVENITNLKNIINTQNQKIICNKIKGW